MNIELRRDFIGEIAAVTEKQFKQMTIITKENAKLGAEVGSIFIQFADIQDAFETVKSLNGRIYNTNEIRATFIEEMIYIFDLKL